MAEQPESPDRVCREFADKGVKLSTSAIDPNLVLIEGDRLSLHFLGRLIFAQAHFEKDCGFEISPLGAGDPFFASDSTRGFYFHVSHEESLKPPNRLGPGTELPQGGKRTKQTRNPVRLTISRDLRTSDSIAEAWAEAGAKLTVKHLNRKVVLVEGDRVALELLARLIMAEAHYGDEDRGFHLSPRGPGGALFTKNSTRGFYIHVKNNEPLETPSRKSSSGASQGSKSRRNGR